jgi:acetyl esterase/lipase
VPRAALPGVVLYVHGGGFVSCSAATHRPITAALARLTARTVFSVDYRLAPEHRFPAAVEDVFAAYEWLLAAAGPNQRIALAGDSAGGNLVLGLSVRLRDQRRPAPACVVAFSPWTDHASSGQERWTRRIAVVHRRGLADLPGTCADTVVGVAAVFRVSILGGNTIWWAWVHYREAA